MTELLCIFILVLIEQIYLCLQLSSFLSNQILPFSQPQSLHVHIIYLQIGKTTYSMPHKICSLKTCYD